MNMKFLLNRKPDTLLVMESGVLANDLKLEVSGL